MSAFIGRKIHVGIAKESVRGTLVAPTYWVPKYDVNIQNKPEYINDEQSFGNIGDTDNARIINEMATGDISGKVRDSSFGLFLLSALGSVSSAVNETTAYDHTFTIDNTNSHQSLSIEVKNDNEQLAHALCVMDSLKINAEVGSFVEFETTFSGKTGTAAVNTPSYTAENEFVAKDVTFAIADDYASIGSATEMSVKSVETSITKNLEADQVLGSNEPEDFHNKQFTIEMNVEALFDATTIKGYYESGATKAIRLTIVDSSTTIGASSNPSIVVDLPLITFQEFEVAGGNDDLVTQNFMIKGHYSITDSLQAQIVLTNEVTSY